MVGVNRIAATVIALMAPAIVAGCAPPRGLYDDMPQLRVGTRIALASMCAGSQSPPIALANVPTGTSQYRVRISNVSVLWQAPAEWTIPAPAEPSLIPLGALPGYSGPCPGEQQQFTYRFEVLALGARGEPVAYGATNLRIRSVNELAQETWRRAGRGQAADSAEPPAFESDGSEGSRPRRDRPEDVFGVDRDTDRGAGPLPFPSR